jgi:hypothetical protein
MIGADSYNAMRSLIASLRADLERLERLIEPAESEVLDPADPRNKVGANLTPRGAEICYRMFDRGLTRYAVKEAFRISFGAANYRYSKWLQAGGPNRPPQSLDGQL